MLPPVGAALGWGALAASSLVIGALFALRFRISNLDLYTKTLQLRSYFDNLRVPNVWNILFESYSKDSYNRLVACELYYASYTFARNVG